MDGGMIAALVIAAIFFGSIIWIEFHSRRQAAKKETPQPSEEGGQAPETELPAGQRNRKKK